MGIGSAAGTRQTAKQMNRSGVREVWLSVSFRQACVRIPAPGEIQRIRSFMHPEGILARPSWSPRRTLSRLGLYPSRKM